MPLAFAYLSDGHLFMQRGRDAARLIESPFALDLVDRAARHKARQGWRFRGGDGALPPSMLWNFGGSGAVEVDRRGARFSGLACAGPGQLLYALDLTHSAGVFTFDTKGNDERRLMHRQGFRPSDLSAAPIHNGAAGRIAMSVMESDGSAHIAVMDGNGSRLRSVTEGDAVDESPTWSRAGDERLIYQSAGIARNQHGVAVLRGPYAIMELNLERGDLNVLAEDDHLDFLQPRQSADGSLYFIRRPYQPREPYHAGHLLLDVVLFPYRLLRALFYFLNFMSMIFASKPLSRAGGPKLEQLDTRHLMLWGKVIDTQRAIRDMKSGKTKSLVPANWELVHRPNLGDEQVLARGVLSYDLTADGGVLYTNGRTVHHRAANGRVEEIARAPLVERVVALAQK